MIDTNLIFTLINLVILLANSVIQIIFYFFKNKSENKIYNKKMDKEFDLIQTRMHLETFLSNPFFREMIEKSYKDFMRNPEDIKKVTEFCAKNFDKILNNKVTIKD